MRDRGAALGMHGGIQMMMMLLTMMTLMYRSH